MQRTFCAQREANEGNLGMIPKIDLTGKKFGRLTVGDHFIRSPTTNQFMWHCVCDCGSEKFVEGAKLRDGHTKSCGCLHKEQLIARNRKSLPRSGPAQKRRRANWTGRIFSRLTVIDEAELGRWRCRCICGVEAIILDSALQSGKTKSCGCLRIETTSLRARKHGAAGSGNKTWTPEYRAWSSMKTRCCSKYVNRPDYKNYYGRGIRICARWLESFENFLADVGPRPSPKHSLDRYPDNDGNYEPGNVRWATATEQRINQRPRQRRAA